MSELIVANPAAAGELPQAYKDEILKAISAGLKSEGVQKSVAELVEGSVAKAYSDREAVIQAKADSMASSRVKAKSWEEATDGTNPIGVIAHALARTKGNQGEAREFAEKAIGASVAKALNLSDATQGGIFVQGEVLDFFFDALRPSAAFLAMNPTRLPMPERSMTVSGFTGDSSFTWVGETVTSEVASTPTTGARKLSAKKGETIIPINNSMLGTSAGPRVFKMVETNATKSVANGLDAAGWRGAGTDHTPKGIRHWAATTTAMTATPTLTTAFADFRIALTALTSANVPGMRLGWGMNPRVENWLKFAALDGFTHPYFLEEMRQGTLLGYPFGSTNNIPKNLGGGTESELYLADWEQVLVGDVLNGGLRIEYFREGSYTLGGSLVSLMQRDEQAVRIIVETDYNVTYPEAVHVTTGLTWGA